MITTAQKSLINKLKAERDMVITDLDSYTKRDAQKEITRLINIKATNLNVAQQGNTFIPITENQFNKIMELAEELRLKPDLQIIKSWSTEKASQQIQLLIEKNMKQYREFATEKQVEMIKDMLVCTDIRQEEINTLLAINTDYKDNLQRRLSFLLKNDTKHQDIENLKEEIVKETKKLQQEIENADFTRIDSIKAKDFISRNSKAFYNWKDTRATDRQINMAMQLQEQLYTVNGWVANTEQIAGLDGNAFSTDESSKYIKDESYSIQNTLTKEELKLMSREQISKYIKQLECERSQKFPSSLEIEVERVDKRNIISQEVATERDRQKVIEIIYGLNAMQGLDVDETDVEQFESPDDYLVELIEQTMLYCGDVNVIEYIQDKTSDLNKHLYKAMANIGQKLNA